MIHVIRSYAQLLSLPATVNKVRFLAALCRQESSGGRNLGPNFEPSFYVGGRWYEDAIVAPWRDKAESALADTMVRLCASSWGPWQVMFPTAVHQGYAGPPWGLHSPPTCIKYAIRFINKRLIGDLESLHSMSELDIVRALADGYNSGDPDDAIEVKAYRDSVVTFYVDPTTEGRLVAYSPDV
jgi:hypothetical protein